MCAIVTTRLHQGDTILNLTNHSYFNLDGCSHPPVSSICDHELRLVASSFAAVDNTGIPTGIVQIAEGSAFDFSKSKRVGTHIDEAGNEQLQFQKGYDHSFKIERNHENELALCAELKSVRTGRVLQVCRLVFCLFAFSSVVACLLKKVLTTEPFVHFYSGNHLHEKLAGRNGAVYSFRTGLCLETQHLPNAPNVDQSAKLKKDETFNSTTIFRFSVQ